MMMINDEAKILGGGGGVGGTKTNSSDFIKKPGKGWLHSDESIQEGITYTVKYIGFIGVKESMKSLSFDVRTQVARESIRRVAENAKCINLSRRNRASNDEQINRILSNACVTQWSGMSVQLHINTQVLKVTQLECNETLFQHTMQNISFACGGDTDIQDYVAYVAKDDVNGRACYVFECGNNLANSVITTVGQAFELRFKKFLNSMPTMKTTKTTPSPTHANVEKPLTQVKYGMLNDKQDVIINTSVNSNLANKMGQQPTPKHLNNAHLTNIQHHHHHQPPPTTMPPTTSTNNVVISPEHTYNKPPILNNHLTTNKPHVADHQQHKSQQNGQHHGKMDEKLEKMPWFHGLLTRENAEKLLTRDGDYLVRETNKAEKQYVLSGRYKGECRHIFLVDPTGVIRTKDRVFDNICHLIQYHQDNKIPIISKENELLLEHPVYK